MASVALQVCIAYFVVSWLEMCVLSWQCLTRPIVVAPLAGLIMGDFRTGIIMGAALESIFMGISAIGGSVPADACTSSIIAVAFTILTGSSVEEGLAIAMPIGTVMASLSGLLTPLWAGLAAYWEKLAMECNPKKFLTTNLLVSLVSGGLVNTIILFFAISVGVEGLNALLASLPVWVMTGLGAASGMMLAVGFAILTSMIWSGEVAVFFFVGYVLVKFAGLGTVPIAIIGAAIAITMFFSEKKLADLKGSLATSGTAANDEEDFF